VYDGLGSMKKWTFRVSGERRTAAGDRKDAIAVR
jgi:hypothetical protein